MLILGKTAAVSKRLGKEHQNLSLLLDLRVGKGHLLKVYEVRFRASR